MTEQEIAALARQVGLEATLRAFPDVVQEAAARALAPFTAFPKGWRSTLEPAAALDPVRGGQ